MIDPKELRIGNFVGFNGENNETGFISALEQYLILPKQSFVKLNHRIDKKYNCKDIDPIQLTEEWLLNFGFEKSNEQAYDSSSDCLYDLYTLSGFKIIRSGNDFYHWVEIEDNYYSFKNKVIVYVHRLQNLYFDLKDEELNVDKEPGQPTP